MVSLRFSPTCQVPSQCLIGRNHLAQKSRPLAPMSIIHAHGWLTHWVQIMLNMMMDMSHPCSCMIDTSSGDNVKHDHWIVAATAARCICWMTNLHSKKAFVPARNDVPTTKGEMQGALVELSLATFEEALIEYVKCFSVFRRFACCTSICHFITSWRRVHCGRTLMKDCLRWCNAPVPCWIVSILVKRNPQSVY